MFEYQNPIIKGYNPDPSICRAGEDYYLVTSSFEFFPGVPIYHSKNLVDWELINYCLKSNSQLPLESSRCSGGIFAPTIRYHDGIFYMITTNVTDGGNFIVHTDDIYGEWSEPAWIEQGGIDPSLFFDNDGKVYFCNTSGYEKRSAIFAFEINPKTGEIIGEKHVISYGFGGKFPEAPHIYKRGKYYYLMLAEGGTEYGHMETMLRSENIYGPYESCPYNPILSHKDYMGAPIQATGHADIIEASNGDWWMVCLAIRPLGYGMLHNLGRETFLTPMKWSEDGWPLVGENGRIELTMQANLPEKPSETANCINFYDSFDKNIFDLNWNFVRNPKIENYRLENNTLIMQAKDENLSSKFPTFMGVRQQEFNICAQTKVTLVEASVGGNAGIAAFYNQNYYYSLSIEKENDINYIVLTSRLHDVQTIINKVAFSEGNSIELKLESNQREYVFSAMIDSKWVDIGHLPTAGLCTEGTMTMTFTGTYIGLYANEAKASFDFFKVIEI